MNSNTDRDVYFELRKLSPWKWFIALLFDWSIIIVSMAVAIQSNHWVVYILALLLIGFRQHGLAVLGHEAAHKLVTKNLPLNNFLGNVLCFWPLVLNIYGYQRMHVRHHRHLKTKDDPELKILELKHYSLPVSRISFVKRAFVDLMGFGFSDQMKVSKMMKSEKVADSIAVYVVCVCITLAFIAGDIWQVPALWFGALGTSFFCVNRLRTWTEHTGMDDTYIFHIPPIIRFAIYPHNVWIHDTHHKYPNIPFYNLRKALLQNASKMQGLLCVYRQIFRATGYDFTAKVNVLSRIPNPVQREE